MTHTIRGAAALAVLLVGLPGLRTDALAQQGWVGTIAGISFSNQDAENPRLAFDAAGNAIAIWDRYDTPNPVIQVSHYSAATGSWQIPIDVSPPTQASFAPDIAIDAQGNATAVWLRFDGVVYVLQAARATVDGSTWSAPVDIATVGPGALGPAVMVTPAGDALVIWTRLVGISASVHAARYVASSGTWRPAVSVSAVGTLAYLADFDIEPDGDAVAVWTRFDGTDEVIDSARYTAATDSWSPAIPLSAGGAFTEYARVALDAVGNAVATWNREGAIETSRYDTASATWSPAAVISGLEPAFGEPRLASDADGNAIAVWRVASTVQVARYSASGGVWSSALPLSPLGQPGFEPRIAIDPLGNAVVIWRSWSGSRYVLQSSRFVRATATWGAATTFSNPTQSAYQAEIVADPRGNVAAVWDGWDGEHEVIRTTRWEATPNAPGIVAVTPTAGGTIVTFTAPLTTDAVYAATSYEYSISTRPWVLAGATSPIGITGLEVGAYQLALRAMNPAGAGAIASTPFVVNPSPPSGVVATSVSGNTVALSWLAPADAPPGSTYVVEGGVVPGQTLASIATASSATSYTFTAPTGAFFVRVRAAYFQLRSSPSNEILIVVNVPAPPSAPTHLLGLVSGASLALSWTNTYGGGAPTGLQLHVSGAIDAALPLGFAETFAAPVVPPGTYTIRMAATNASGVSALSNPVTLTVPGACSGVPGVPTRVVATSTGRAIRVVWSPPDTGAAVSAYWLIVGGSFVGAFPTTARTLAGTVGPGTYSFVVVAVNACGAGAQSLQEIVAVP